MGAKITDLPEILAGAVAADDVTVLDDISAPESKKVKVAELVKALLARSVAFSGAITPAALAADVDDYAPTGHADAFAILLSATGSVRTVTGLAGGYAGRLAMLVHASGTPILLANDSVSSVSANRIVNPEGSHAVRMEAGDIVVVQWLASLSKWVSVWRSGRASLVHRETALAPTATDDQTKGFKPGDLWVDDASGFYICGSAMTGVAIWRQLVQSVRTIATSTGLLGGGDLSANRTLSIDWGEVGDIQPLGTAAAGATGEVADAGHVHAHGNQTNGSEHTIAEAGKNGFMPAEDYDLMHDGTLFAGDPAEDFLGNQGVTGTQWLSSLTGTGAAVNGLGSVSQHPGIIQLHAGTTTTGRAAIYRGGSTTFKVGADGIICNCLFRVPTLSTVSEEFSAMFGWSDTLFAEAAHGVYLLYDRLINTQLLACAASSSTRTRTATGVTLNAGDWIRVRIVLNAAGTAAEFYVGVNGATPALVATVSTNLPGAATLWTAQAMILKSAGTTSRNIDIDRIRGWYWQLASAR